MTWVWGSASSVAVLHSCCYSGAVRVSISCPILSQVPRRCYQSLNRPLHLKHLCKQNHLHAISLQTSCEQSMVLKVLTWCSCSKIEECLIFQWPLCCRKIFLCGVRATLRRRYAPASPMNSLWVCPFFSGGRPTKVRASGSARVQPCPDRPRGCRGTLQCPSGDPDNAARFENIHF